MVNGLRNLSKSISRGVRHLSYANPSVSQWHRRRALGGHACPFDGNHHWDITWFITDRPVGCRPGRYREEVAKGSSWALFAAGASCAAVSLGAAIFLRKRDQVIRDEVAPDDLSLLCEGERGLACAYTGSRSEWCGCVLRLWKADSCEPAAVVADWKVSQATQYGLFSSNFVNPGRIVALPVSNVREIDAHIFSSRSARYRETRLAETHCPGHAERVAGLCLQDLSALPILAEAGRLLTVQLRPGCGLSEANGLPSRHVLRKHVLVQQGMLDHVSEYNPLDLYSGDKKRVESAIQAMLADPQGHISIHVDGGAIDLNPESLSRGLEAAGVSSVSDLVSMALEPGRGALVELRRVQSWAAGDAEQIACRILTDLVTNFNDEKEAIASVRTPEAVQAAAAGVARCPANEQGIVAHVKEGRRLMAQGGPKSKIRAERWLCRFLLGRAAFEAGVVINLLNVSAPEQETVKTLKALRFVPLGDTKFWARVTIVGCASPSEVPKGEPGAEQRIPWELEALVAEYRNASQDSSSK